MPKAPRGFIALSPDTKRMLDDHAKEQGRTIRAQAEMILRQYLSRHKGKPRKAG